MCSAAICSHCYWLDESAKCGPKGCGCTPWALFTCFNSLAPGWPGCHFKTAIFNLVLLIGILTSAKDNALRLMPRDLTDDKSTLVQVMAWCCQATSHYLSQCWPNSPVTGEFPSQRPVTRSFDVFFDLRLNIWLNKQLWGWWFEMPLRSLWRHCNE